MSSNINIVTQIILKVLDKHLNLPILDKYFDIEGRACFFLLFSNNLF